MLSIVYPGGVVTVFSYPIPMLCYNLDVASFFA
jgi:hypothetical protein